MEDDGPHQLQPAMLIQRHLKQIDMQFYANILAMLNKFTLQRDSE